MQVSKFILLSLCLVIFVFPVLSISQTENPDVSNKEKSEINIEPPKESQTEETLIDSNDLVHIGDLIDVDVLGSTEFDWRGEVSPEGFLSGLNFIKNVNALCRSETELSEEIANLYTKFLRNPKVRVRILDRTSRPTSTILGAVKIPQRFQLKRNVFLNELIILSGGLTDKANGDIQILRRQDTNCLKSENTESAKNETTKKKADDERNYLKVGQDNGLKIINIKVSELIAGLEESNPQILYGDIITVRGAEPVYVTGGVVNPGKVLFRPEITVSRAIATAGGLTKKADSKNIRVFRREGSDTKIIKLDLDLITADVVKEDFILKPFDIVDVGGKDEERKYPPIIESEDSETLTNSNLPLRVID